MLLLAFGRNHRIPSDTRQETPTWPLAVGASRADVMRLVLREGGVTAVAGAVAGIAIALAGSRYVEAVLFGVTPTDPLTYAAIALVLLGAVLIAVGIPPDAPRGSRQGLY